MTAKPLYRKIQPVPVERRASGTSTPNPKPIVIATREADPPALPPGIDSIDQIGGLFFVAHVKSRQEKAFVIDLAVRNVPYFLPMGERISFSGRERYIVRQPLFSQYVFVAGDDEAGNVQASVMGLPMRRVCRTVPIRDQAKVRRELGDLLRWTIANPRLESCPGILPGVLCRVTAGALQGMTGRVIQRGRDMCISMAVETLGQSVLATIDSRLLEVI